jgi:uncharacterized protein DUF6174
VKKRGTVVLTLAIVASPVLVALVFLPRTLRTISLHRAERRWQDTSIQDYTWRLDTGCFGACTDGTPVVIEVRDGEPVHVTGSRPPSLEGSPMTVEQLFHRVEREVGADGYSVTFDPELGLPTEGHFDPSRASTDDEWGFTVVSLQIG